MLISLDLRTTLNLIACTLVDALGLGLGLFLSIIGVTLPNN